MLGEVDQQGVGKRCRLKKRWVLVHIFERRKMHSRPNQNYLAGKDLLDPLAQAVISTKPQREKSSLDIAEVTLTETQEVGLNT
jgi:hypothetical protein